MSSEQFRPAPFKILPHAVKNLLIINGLCFLAGITAMNAWNLDLNDLLGLHYFSAEKFRPYQIITYMFMHQGFTHILFNMFALWMFGSSLENFWGPKKFLIYYFVTGIGAAVCHYTVIYFELQPELLRIDSIINSSSIQSEEARLYKINLLNSINVVGASGAVFGLLLAFGMTFPNSLVYIYFAIPMKAKYFVMLYAGLELFSGIRNSSTDNVAHYAHLGGALAGFILLMIWKYKSKFRRH